MAGSLKWFVYTTDSGQDFALYADESNIEAVNGGTQDYPNTAGVQFAVPRNLTPRKVTYESADGSVRRSVVALTQTIYDGVNDNQATIIDQVSGATLSLRRKVGEIIRLPFGVDTGITDGDAT